MNIDIEEIKARAEAATPIVLIGAMVSKNNAEFLKSAKGDVLALVAEVERLQSELDRVTAERDAAVEDVPHKCLYCAKRLGWETCKDASYISDGEVCLNFEYLGVERSE